MGWRVGAAWALIGFAAQCVAALVDGTSVDQGLKRALLHYVAWGVAGFLAGALAESVAQESFRRTVDREKEAEAASSAESRSEPSTPTS